MAIETQDAAGVVQGYFEAMARRDPAALAAHWSPDGVEHLHGVADLRGPDGVREYFTAFFASFPDLTTEVLDVVSQDDRVAVHWRSRGTFAGPEPFRGIAPTGARVELEGIDLLRVRDGRLVRNDAHINAAVLAEQIGLMPAPGSAQERRLTRLFNARTRLARRITGEPERVADGVWLVRGGFPGKTMNVYLIEEPDGSGVCLFDAGIKAMTNGLAATGATMGGITRIVLGHAHQDHRGAAPGLGVPVFCHEADRADAEGDAGARYMHLERLKPQSRLVFPHLLRWWDGGPVPIAGTVAEGDEVAGFRVIHLPGHAPGLIGLWRERDRLALTSDCFYTLDPETGRHGPPRVPHAAFNQDTEQARASIRKLAALEPAAAWPAHADPLTGDVRAQLERAAAAT